MGNKFLVGVLVVVVGVLAGVSLLASISTAINSTMAPMAGKLHEISMSQRNIEQKIAKNSDSENTDNILARLSAIENKISALERRGVAAAPTVQPPQPPAEDYDKQYEIPVGQSYVWGNKNAPVTIVEFIDFQCPFCSRFHPPVLEVLKTYPNDVKYILKNFPLPFHPQARPAAKAALAAGEQGKYFEMADLLLENNQNLSDDKFKELAGKAGLNVDKFMKDYQGSDAEWEKRIQDDMTLAQQVDFRGTPMFYINGRKTDARDFNNWKLEIDKILEQ